MTEHSLGLKHRVAGTLIGLACAIYFIQMNPEDGIVPRDALVKAEGTVLWVEDMDSIQFDLSGSVAEFSYPAKSGATGMVRRVLNEAGGNTVTVLYDTKGRSPVYLDEVRYDVWELHMGDRPIRTYDETTSA